MLSIFKVLIKIALIAIIVGLIVAVIGFAISGFDFKKLSSTELKTITASIENESAIDKLTLDFNTTDVYVIYSDTAEELSITYTVEHNKKSGEPLNKIREFVEGSRLTIIEERSFSEIINFFYHKETRVDVTVPKNRSLALDIELSTGDTFIKGMTVPAPIKVDATTGDITIDTSVATVIDLEGTTTDVTVKDTKCASLEVEVSTGDVAIINTVCDGELQVDSTTGDLLLRDVTAGAITRDCSSGDTEIRGLVKAVRFACEITTGDLECEGGRLDAEKIDIEATSGDIELNLVREQSEYSILVEVVTGESNVRSQQGGPGEIRVNATTSDVEIYFAR